MNSQLILIIGKSATLTQELLRIENRTYWKCLEVPDVSEAYKLSFIYTLDMVIINKRLDDFEEHVLITFLNQKNASTILIPYGIHIKNRLKKHFKRLLKINHYFQNLHIMPRATEGFLSSEFE
tara:strand:+ start:35516 stop:35884 length:369 start_codon:yes stop_codon:yes gene_type:complete